MESKCIEPSFIDIITTTIGEASFVVQGPTFVPTLTGSGFIDITTIGRCHSRFEVYVVLVLTLDSTSVFVMHTRTPVTTSDIRVCNNQFWRRGWAHDVLDHCPSPSLFCGSSFVI